MTRDTSTPPGTETSRVRTAAAIASLVAVEGICLTLLSRVPQPSSAMLFALYGVAFAAYVALWRQSRNAVPAWVWLAVALALRLPWLGAGLSLSDDAWRYLHDGRAQMAGVNPFRYPPAAPEAAAYAGPEHDLINHPDLPTIYPPFAQLTFRVAVAVGGTLLAWKLVLLAFDLGIGLAVMRLLRSRGRPAGLASAYLLHPLVIIEFSGNGHVDAVAIAALMWAFVLAARRPVLGGAAWAASVAAKYLALPLIAFFGRDGMGRAKWMFLASALWAGVLIYVPFTDPFPFGSLGAFARDFEFNGALYDLLALIGRKDVVRVVLAGGLVTVLAWLWWRGAAAFDAAFVWVAAVLLASPIVHPWYVTWLIPFLAIRPEPWAVTWSATVVLAYSVLPRWWTEQVWTLSPAMQFLEYAPVYLLLAYQTWRHYRPTPATGIAPPDPPA